jgi:hypothetical protein
MEPNHVDTYSEHEEIARLAAPEPPERAGAGAAGGLPGARAPVQAPGRTWREIAENARAGRDPVNAEAAERAQRAPEPSSLKEPKASQSALEKSLADLENELAAQRPFLSEEENRAIDSAIAAGTADDEQRARSLADTLACLFTAGAT